jgi:glycerate kinase
MKIVIAPDSFKESMTSLEAAKSIEKGFKAVLPEAEYVNIPVADGGEGTVQSLIDATEEISYSKQSQALSGSR